MAFCAERHASGVREVGGVGVKPLLLTAADAAVARGGDGFGIAEKCRTMSPWQLLQVSLWSTGLTTVFQQPAVFCENKSGASDMKLGEPALNCKRAHPLRERDEER